MRDDHYFSAAPGAPHRRRTVPLALADLNVELVSDAGVFAADRVDPGTELLLAEAPAPPATGDLVDLGCGYGPVAVTLAHRAPGATVWAVDVNARARALCAENAERLGLGNVRVAHPDEVPPDLSVASVWSNPPVRIGRAALHDLLGSWLGRLGPQGWALLVVHRHLGADSLARWLGAQGWSVERLRSRRGYRLLRVGVP